MDVLDPARRAKPKDKPRCERQIPYVRGSLWRGRDFLTLAAMRTEALRWCVEVAGARACRPLGGAAPKSATHRRRVRWALVAGYGSRAFGPGVAAIRVRLEAETPIRQPH